MQFSHDADTDIRIYDKDESACTESTLYAQQLPQARMAASAALP